MTDPYSLFENEETMLVHLFMHENAFKAHIKIDDKIILSRTLSQYDELNNTWSASVRDMVKSIHTCFKGKPFCHGDSHYTFIRFVDNDSRIEEYIKDAIKGRKRDLLIIVEIERKAIIEGMS